MLMAKPNMQYQQQSAFRREFAPPNVRQKRPTGVTSFYAQNISTHAIGLSRPAIDVATRAMQLGNHLLLTLQYRLSSARDDQNWQQINGIACVQTVHQALAQISLPSSFQPELVA